MENDALPSMVIWLDPGQTSGYAYITDKFAFHSGQLGFQQLGQQLELSCSIHEESLWLGWESFVLNSLTASKHGSEKALEVIGLARYLAQKYECVILPSRMPSSRDLGGLQKLKRIGWYRTGQPHANDAAMHLLSYLLQNHMLPDDLLRKAIMGDNGHHVAI